MSNIETCGDTITSIPKDLTGTLTLEASYNNVEIKGKIQILYR